jgi:membrane protein required for colicin V production
MNYFDLIIAVLIVLSAINGFKKGFIYQLASLAALILGIYLAVKFSKVIAPFINSHITSSANASKIIAFVFIFIIVMILVTLLGKFLEKVLEEVELGIINKIAGLVFGVVKSLFVISALMIFLQFSIIKFNWPSQQTREGSFLYKPIESVAPALFPYLKSLGQTADEQKTSTFI